MRPGDLRVRPIVADAVAVAEHPEAIDLFPGAAVVAVPMVRVLRHPFDDNLAQARGWIEMQLGFREKPSIPVRIGIHVGDIMFSDDDIVGDAVRVA